MKATDTMTSASRPTSYTPKRLLAAIPADTQLPPTLKLYDPVTIRSPKGRDHDVEADQWLLVHPNTQSAAVLIRGPLDAPFETEMTLVEAALTDWLAMVRKEIRAYKKAVADKNARYGN